MPDARLRRLAERLRRRTTELSAVVPVHPAWVEACRAVRGGDPDPAPHPLLEPLWVDPRRPWLAQGLDFWSWYAADPAHRRRSSHPLVSLAVVDDQVPGARHHPAGPVVAWLEHVAHSPDALLPSRPGTPPVTLGRLVELSLAALAPTGGAARDRPAAGVSVVVALGDDLARAVNWVRGVGELRAAGTDVDVVAVAGDGTRSLRVLTRVVAEVHDVAVPVLLDGPVPVAAALAVGLRQAAGGRVVLVRPGVVPDAAAAVALAAALDTPGVVLAQPLLVDRRDVVVSAGAWFSGDPVALEPFLAGHAPADAERLGPVDLPAALSPVVATTPELVALAGGLEAADGDQPEVGLGLRAARHGRVVLDPTTRLTWTSGTPAAATPYPGRTASDAPLATAGFDPAGYRRLRDAGIPLDRPRVTEAAPRLRWTIDTAARAGRAGETWGDTHFARSLARSLERLGQLVAVDPAPARDRWTRGLDDVVLVLRGLDVVVPRADTVNLLWVISHPEQVTRAEAARFDHVLAASVPWSAARAAEWGRPVTALLQCTDPELFSPGRAEPDTGADVLLVANARGVVRPALAGALAAGALVTVHGTGWPAVLADLEPASDGVPNAEVGALYAAARVVLNDHWADMRRDGFVANRLFDATACAARVVSDDVAGIADLFGAQVATFGDPGEVGGLLARVPDGWPSYDERVRLAERVRREHSFDTRAATLLETAVRSVRERR